jgi:hypothetical protein
LELSSTLDFFFFFCSLLFLPPSFPFFPKKKKKKQIDHIIPLSKGGRSDWSNLVTACSRCNSSKGSQTLEQLGWKLARQPRAPQRHELAMSSEGAPAEWKLWLPSANGNKLGKA